MSGKIYTGQVDNAQDCSCPNVVLPSIPHLKPENYQIMDQQVCPTCKCSYQRRNLTVIYAVVVFVCVLVSAFAFYLIMTQVIWPRFIVSLSYKEQRDDEIVMEEVTENSKAENQPQPDQASSSRSKFLLINYISHHQSKWQKDLHEQQRNIYQDHTMLN